MIRLSSGKHFREAFDFCGHLGDMKKKNRKFLLRPSASAQSNTARSERLTVKAQAVHYSFTAFSLFIATPEDRTGQTVASRPALDSGHPPSHDCATHKPIISG